MRLRKGDGLDFIHIIDQGLNWDGFKSRYMSKAKLFPVVETTPVGTHSGQVYASALHSYVL